MQRKTTSYKESFKTLTSYGYSAKEISLLVWNKIFNKGQNLSELIEELKKIEDLLEQSNTFVIVSDLYTMNWVYLSKGVQNILGLSSVELEKIGANYFINNFCLPDKVASKVYFDKIMNDYMKNENINDLSNYSFNMPIRFLHKKGYYKWLYNRLIFSHVNEKNKPTVSISVVTDIDDFKKDDLLTCTITKFDSQSNEHKMVFSDSKMPEGMNLLSEVELMVLSLLADGYTNKQIADNIGYAESTIKDLRKKMLKKTWCSNITELVYFSLRNKLIS